MVGHNIVNVNTGVQFSSVPQMEKSYKICHECNTYSIRIDKFDAYACKKCMIWLEDKCNDSKCEFCCVRPETPKDVNWKDVCNT
jgi:hypothetical protein